MSWRDGLVLAARGVRRRIGRAALTVLAVSLAAALLTALLLIADTAKLRVIGQLTRGGPLATIRVEGSSLGEADLRRIAHLPDVRAVLPVAVTQEVVIPPDPATFRARPTAAKPTTGAAAAAGMPLVDGVIGIDVSHADRFPVTLLAGRLPTPGSRTEVAVTADYLGRVGVDRDAPASVLGTELELGAPRFLGSDLSSGVWARWTRAAIVGVVAQEAGSGDIVAPVGDVVRAQAFTAGGATPTSGLAEIPGVGTVALPTSASAFAAFLVEARSLDRVGAALDEMSALGYSTSAPENLVATVQKYLHVVQIVLTSIGIIALAIAALGIASALFAAIRERRREIGVMKAIGARDRDVRRIFLIEAGIVGVVGGLLGSIAGWGIARAVAAVVNAYLVSQGLQGVRLVAPLAVLAGAVAGALALSVVAGALPARRASRLPATEAVGE